MLTHNNFIDLARAGACQLANVTGQRIAPFHTAGLQYSVVLTHRLDHRASLADRQRERFFTVDVFPCLGREDRNDCVPMIRHDHGHGIDVVTDQNIVKVAGGGAASVCGHAVLRGVVFGDLFPRRFAAQELILGLVAIASRIYITDSDDLYVGVLHEPAQDRDPLVTHANTSDLNPIARRIVAEYRRRNNPRHRGRRGRCRVTFEKTTAVH